MNYEMKEGKSKKMFCRGLSGVGQVVLLFCMVVVFTYSLRATDAGESNRVHWQGEMAGEVTRDSVILQARLTLHGKIESLDVKGRAGVGAFELADNTNFKDALRTQWMTATSEGDYILKKKVASLKPGTRYYYRLLSGKNEKAAKPGPVGTFRTLDAKGTSRETSFVVVTGMNEFAFLMSSKKNKHLGFPGLEAIVSQRPDFLVATGDNVYYDVPFVGRARSRRSMRAKWHRQFATPRFATFFQNIPVYWEKDDHDYRYNDADPHGPFSPSHELGIDIFREQVPVVDPDDKNAVTYRTHRVNYLLQIWLLEGRDYRDANIKPPGRGKTMWGAEQKAWLYRTLLESDATFKIIVSPTPLIGPDDKMTGVQVKYVGYLLGASPIGQKGDNRKRDNHTNEYGFRDEAEAFFRWLKKNGFLGKNFFIACGDRHWQYQSVRPDGFEEFSSGALVDNNARLGCKPGDPDSTDPKGLIRQAYAQSEKSGGFLKITVRPPKDDQRATATFAFYDENGKLLHEVEKIAH